MDSKIFNAAVKLIFPVQVVFSFIVLLRGHNGPGGGFIGGLILAVSILLRALTSNKKKSQFFLRPKILMAIGLLCSLLAGLIGLAFNRPFLTGIWSEINFFGFIPSTVFLFDLGVYLLVTGMVLQVVQALEEEVEL
ncbi:MAG: MnhB domain-containing protein [Bacteriovoracaceae bacterium]